MNVIIYYSINQTGPEIQFGDLKKDLINILRQSDLASFVENSDRNPKANVKMMQSAIFILSVMLLILNMLGIFVL